MKEVSLNMSKLLKVLLAIMFIILQISHIESNLNITSGVQKMKSILSNYKCHRHKRCTFSTKTNKLQSFLEKSLKVFGKVDRYGEFLKFRNVSECTKGDIRGASSYMNEHIVNGLLVDENVPESHWMEYKQVFGKIYPSHHHETAARAKWRENLRRVAQHNREHLAGKHTYTLHLNQLADLGSTDYFTKILKLITTIHLFDPAEDHHKTAYWRNSRRRVPRHIDWRSAGFKPRRERQLQCGACYAFAITHALQAQLYKKHRNWKELSPQQIVDCSTRDGNAGCGGGSLRAALRYVAREGLVVEEQYPYVGKKGRCHVKPLARRVRPRRWATLPARDEALEKALATIGPLAVAVNASPFTFQLYRSGIYDDPFCTPWKMNHAMLLVGYTPQYWILLNWWGKDWGEDGYMRIRRGFNRCGVANMATYVEL